MKSEAKRTLSPLWRAFHLPQCPFHSFNVTRYRSDVFIFSLYEPIKFLVNWLKFHIKLSAHFDPYDLSSMLSLGNEKLADSVALFFEDSSKLRDGVWLIVV